jgi:hypothetical protein
MVNNTHTRYVHVKAIEKLENTDTAPDTGSITAPIGHNMAVNPITLNIRIDNDIQLPISCCKLDAFNFNSTNFNVYCRF